MNLAIVPLLVVMSPAAVARHPLDPLSGEEIAKTTAVITAAKLCDDPCLYPFVSLHEPDKAAVGSASRQAQATVLDRAHNRVTDVVVDLAAGKVVATQPQPDAQPIVMMEEFVELPRIVRADARWQEAMRRRGITDFDKVHIDAWAQGYDVQYRGKAMRVLRALSFYRGDAVNMYGRPIEGVVAVVNMTGREVLDVHDTGVVPVSTDAFDFFDGKWIGKERVAPKPLKIVQPEGQSFTINDSLIRWQKWNLRAKMQPREGLVLYDVQYEDGPHPRSVLYRGSLSEMVVPYGDPDPAWRWRSAFDVGEYGVGRLAPPLQLGADVPDNAVLLDADFADDHGRPYRAAHVVAVYERDGGTLWKHYDAMSGQNAVRRARELVVTFTTTVGNYDYALSWVFRQDGSIKVEAELMGIMLAKGVEQEGEQCEHAHLVAPGVAAPHHQHFFSFRLDLDVDGPANSLIELNTHSRVEQSSAGKTHSIVMEEVELKSELQARRRMDLNQGRKWAVVNRGVINALGSPAGYALIPGDNTVPFVWPGASSKATGSFIDSHLWGTRYHPNQMYAAGDFPSHHDGTDGLPAWVLDDEPLSGTDLVVWYTMGTTHIPRPEEWPIMPTAKIGFTLLPMGFFTRNPALDVPPPPRAPRSGRRTP